MADLATTLTGAYAALAATGVPVRLEGEADGGEAQVRVLRLVSDTTRQMHGGASGDMLIQVTSYAPSMLDAIALDQQARAALEPLRLHHRQARTAPDPDGFGMLSEFTT